MNQLVVVNKPVGLTSRDVVNKLNHIFNDKKIGHTGTLDPLASGVLVCLFGKYTKLVDLITSYDKEYVAEIKLGVKTDTSDITGNVLEKRNVSISLEDIKNVFDTFPKKYNQKVPKYSAVKIDGKKLYQYAREGIDIKVPSREVSIYELELISFNKDIIKFRTKVSKGTYIRSLIEDICEKLNTIGTMSSLVRTKQGNFFIEDSYTLEEIEKGNYKGLNIHEFLDIPVFEVDEELYKKIINGNKIIDDRVENRVIYTYHNEDIAIYQKQDNCLKPYIML